MMRARVFVLLTLILAAMVFGVMSPLVSKEGAFGLFVMLFILVVAAFMFEKQEKFK